MGGRERTWEGASLSDANDARYVQTRPDGPDQGPSVRWLATTGGFGSQRRLSCELVCV